MNYKFIIRNFVLLLGFIFLAMYVNKHYHEVMGVFKEIGYKNIILATFFIWGSLLSKAIINLYLVKEVVHTTLPSTKIIFSYAESQIVKYIPGKIWSIMFQASTLQKNVKKGDIWIVNLYQMVLINVLSICVILSFFLFIDTIPIKIKILGVLVALVVAGLFYLKSEVLLRICKIDIGTIKKYAHFLAPALLGKIFVVAIMDWLLYFVAWIILCQNRLSVWDAIVVSVNYAASAVVSILVFVVPNGLVVRESIFVGVGQYLGNDLSFLVVFGILLRLLFVAADILLYVVTWIFAKGMAFNAE